MINISQFILQTGISEETLILFVSVPLICAIIVFTRRIIGSMTLGLYKSLFLIILLKFLGIKAGAILFCTTFILMLISRLLLKKIKFLSNTDTRVLDSVAISIMMLISVFMFLFLPQLSLIKIDAIIIVTIIIMASYIQDLLRIWESKGFKNFIAPTIESVTIIFASYLLISWDFFERIIINHPIKVFLISFFLIIVFGNLPILKIKEIIKYRKVIKNVEIPEKN